MAKAANKPKINTLKGDRAALADKAYDKRAPKSVPKPKPKTSPKVTLRVPAKGLRQPTAKAAPAAKAPAASLGDKLKSYLKTSASQIKSGVQSLKVNPKETLKRAVRSMPQGRSARLLVGAAAGAGAAFTAGKLVDKAVASNKKSAAEKRKAYEAARDDIPTAPSAPKAATTSKPKEAKKPAPKASAKAPSAKGKGGNYPVYKKNSSQAASFRAAFAAARKSGQKVFTWEGRKYNTKVKGE